MWGEIGPFADIEYGDVGIGLRAEVVSDDRDECRGRDGDSR